jgi:hypothetical protein
MRNLVTIQTIDWIKPIKDADQIELCGILGWQCVIAKKDNFKTGDKVLYVEIDSVLPEKPEFEFLRSRNFRVRTIKLKGEVSQGLVLPLKALTGGYVNPNNMEVGRDVTDLIGVTKYLSPSEKEEFLRNETKLRNEKNKLKKFLSRYSWFRKLFYPKTIKQNFPYWVTKTDETRVQNIPQILNQFAEKEVYVTEKIDYQSATFTGKLIENQTLILGKFLPKKFKFVVCSRNLTNEDKNSLYWRIAKKYGIEDILKQNPNLTIQGEQGDTKVQGNKYGLTDIKLWVFNIIDHEKGYHFNYDEMKSFCDKYGLSYVPLLKKCKLKELGQSVEELVRYSQNISIFAPIEREGVVVRCVENGQKLISFKVINPKFLLKYE